jgi:hypothetical protein
MFKKILFSINFILKTMKLVRIVKIKIYLKIILLKFIK